MQISVFLRLLSLVGSRFCLLFTSIQLFAAINSIFVFCLLAHSLGSRFTRELSLSRKTNNSCRSGANNEAEKELLSE